VKARRAETNGTFVGVGFAEFILKTQALQGVVKTFESDHVPSGSALGQSRRHLGQVGRYIGYYARRLFNV
jgi:hypothetical protein